MQYCNINNERKEHLLKLIDWIYHEVISACGDGDCLWYSKYYDTKDLLVLVKEYNNKLKHKWNIDFDDNKKEIYWHDYQESIIITNSEETYNSRPGWQQCTIVN